MSAKPQTATEALHAANDADALTRARAEEVSDFFRSIAERMIDEWPRIRFELACQQARQYLRDGAPGRALEVLEQALARYDQEQDQNLGSQPPF